MKALVLLLAMLFGATIVAASAQERVTPIVDPGRSVDPTDGGGDYAHGGTTYYSPPSDNPFDPCTAATRTPAEVLPATTPSPVPPSFARTWNGYICNAAWWTGKITFNIVAAPDHTLSGTWNASANGAKDKTFAGVLSDFESYPQGVTFTMSDGTRDSCRFTLIAEGKIVRVLDEEGCPDNSKGRSLYFVMSTR